MLQLWSTEFQTEFRDTSVDSWVGGGGGGGGEGKGMEFIWGRNFLSEKLHNKAMQRKSDFGEDGTIFLSKIP